MKTFLGKSHKDVNKNGNKRMGPTDNMIKISTILFASDIDF